jgi:hypothetical protein
MIRAMEMVFRATHKRKMTAAERKEFHMPGSRSSGAVSAFSEEVKRVAFAKPRGVVVRFDRSLQRSPQQVKAMENVFRATHKREMTDDERREFQLPTSERPELLVAA